MATTDIFIKTLLQDKVRIKPAELTSTIEQDILAILQNKFEGKCTKHGYIKNRSINIDKCGMGYVQTFSLNGDIIFNVSYYADVCNPAIGSIIDAKVVNMNKFGILAELSVKKDVILEIIIAKSMVNIVNEIPIDNYSINDIITLEILGKKYELGDKKVSIVGRTVKGAANLRHADGSEEHQDSEIGSDDEVIADDSDTDGVDDESDDEGDESEDKEDGDESEADEEIDESDADDDLGDDDPDGSDVDDGGSLGGASSVYSID